MMAARLAHGEPVDAAASARDRQGRPELSTDRRRRRGERLDSHRPLTGVEALDMPGQGGTARSLEGRSDQQLPRDRGQRQPKAPAGPAAERHDLPRPDGHEVVHMDHPTSNGGHREAWPARAPCDGQRAEGRSKPRPRLGGPERPEAVAGPRDTDDASSPRCEAPMTGGADGQVSVDPGQSRPEGHPDPWRSRPHGLDEAPPGVRCIASPSDLLEEVHRAHHRPSRFRVGLERSADGQDRGLAAHLEEGERRPKAPPGRARRCLEDLSDRPKAFPWTGVGEGDRAGLRLADPGARSSQGRPPTRRRKGTPLFIVPPRWSHRPWYAGTLGGPTPPRSGPTDPPSPSIAAPDRPQDESPTAHSDTGRSANNQPRAPWRRRDKGDRGTEARRPTASR